MPDDPILRPDLPASLEPRLRSALRASLDEAWGPHPTWAASPAAQRVTAARPGIRHSPMRLLGVAAVLVTITGAMALVAGALRADPMAAPVENGWIAFVAAEPVAGRPGVEDRDLWLTAPGADWRRVTGTDTDTVDELCPAFSPDGRRLAYGRVDERGTAGSAAALVVADVDEEGRLAERASFDLGPGDPPPCALWSPDGEHLAFAVPRTSPVNPTRSGAGSEVRVMRVADGRVTSIPDLLATDLEWSPDGRSLAISGGSGEPIAPGAEATLEDSRVQRWDLASGTLTTVPGTEGGGLLTWSPDGADLAIEGGGLLRIIDAGTGEERFRTRAESSHGIGPVWSPRGDRIAFQRICAGRPGPDGGVCREHHEVVLIALDGGPGGTPTETARFPTLPDGTGTILFPSRVTWAPTGDRLLVMGWVEGSDVPAPLLVVPVDASARAEASPYPDGLVWSLGEPDTIVVPIQVWGRRPGD